MNVLSKNNLKQFVYLSLIVTIISAAILFYLSNKQILPQKGIFLYPFLFFTINFLVHLLLLKGSQKEPEDFVNYFLIGTTVKLFAYFIFLIIYITVISKTNNRSFAAVFFILYTLFTSVEVFSILKQIKETEKAKNNQVSE